MDKYEYQTKTEQMLEYMEKKQYKKAMEIAEEIDWRRVKNASMLSTVSEIYECSGENEKSRDILALAYERSQGSRKIVYRMGALSVKLNDLQEAADCYEKFVELAPKDPNQYILKYKILRAQNAPLDQQIEVLVDFKKAEYVEKWAYELAKLYHEAGLITECLEECDDLILWFSEGKYVFQAMQLKMEHKPLTPLQQEKYNQCVEEQAKAEYEKMRKLEEQQKAIEEAKKEAARIAAMEAAAAREAEARREAEEKAKLEEMEEEIEAAEAEAECEEAERESAETAAESIEAEMENEMEQSESEAEESEEESAESEADEPESAEEVTEEEAEEPKAVSYLVDENGDPVSAKEKIEGILQDWEVKQRAVEQEIEIKRQQAEAEREAKRRELEEQNRFNTLPIIPDDIQKLLEDLEKGILDDEEGQQEEETEDVPAQEEMSEPETVEEETGAEAFTEEEAETEAETYTEVSEPEKLHEPEKPEFEEVTDLQEDKDIIAEEYEIPASAAAEEPKQEESEEDSVRSALEKLEDAIHSKEDVSPGGVSFNTDFVVQGRYDLEAQSEIGLKAGLTEEQKKLFSYFVPVRGMSEQIVEVLENDKKCKTRYGTSRTGNILVVGRPGTGKTVLAVNVVKAIQKVRKLKQGKVAIVTGEALNKKELSSILTKLKGGALIIEKAGKMNNRTIRHLNELMEEQTGELLIVLEEQRKPLEKILNSNADFKRKFTSKLELPIFINDELVTFGQAYAKENGYKIDEMGILALYSRIDLLQKEDHAVTVAEVKDIMDDAIENAQRANVKHFMKRIFGRRTDNSDRVILTEHDFK